MTIASSNLIRSSGVAAIAAGLSYALVGVFHPPNVLPSVTTAGWIIVHVLAMATSVFGLFGLTGLHARQAKASGWLGAAGYILLSLWLMIILGFPFVEVLLLPVLATTTPALAEAWLAMFNGGASPIDFGALPTVWLLTGPLYILGGLLFGIATFRARVLSRWAGLLLAAGVVIGPFAALLPLDLQPKVAVPVGIALIWLGSSLWSDRRAVSVARSPAVTAPLIA